MNITSPHIDPFSAVNAYKQQTEPSSQKTTVPKSMEQNAPSFEDEIMAQDNLQLEHQNRLLLNEKEKATLHALFGAEKPSEITFYGNAQLQHIHKGQLLDIKG